MRRRGSRDRRNDGPAAGRLKSQRRVAWPRVSRNDRMVVQIEEFIPTDDNEDPIEPFTSESDAARLRVQITRGQAAAFCEHSDDVVAAGRPACLFCGLPVNIDGHACPRMN